MAQPNLFNTDNTSVPIPPIEISFEDFYLTEKSYDDILSKFKIFNESIKHFETKYRKNRNIYFLISFSLVLLTLIYVNSKYMHYEVIPFIWVTFILFGMIFVLIERFFFNYRSWAKKKVEKLKIGPSESEIIKLQNYEEARKVYIQKRNNYEWELSEYNREIKAKKVEYWYSLNGWEFETEFEKLLNKQGFKTQKTRGSSDGGVDIFAAKNNLTYAVQCKAHKSQIGPSIVRELFGAMNHNKIKNGILVNLGGFSRGVIEFANDKSIILLDIESIIKLHEGEKIL
ncbi:MAG: restriction endonuclease [Ignavibacteriaceae bacterium]|nr:restriction endonuclease [Ignavibacteriaceae bacterium]